MIARGDLHWLAIDWLAIDRLAIDEARGSVPAIAHPHVVVQDDVFNRSRIPTVVVCALTSNLKRAHEPGNVLLDEGEGGLGTRSVVIVSQVSTALKTSLGQKIGALSAERVEQILAGLRFQQAAFQRQE